MKFSFQKPEREFEKLLKHALKGEPRAQFLVGDRYHRGYGVVQDVDAAIMWYRKSALQVQKPRLHRAEFFRPVQSVRQQQS